MDLNHQGTLMEALGIEMVQCEKHKVVMRMPISDATRQPLGLLHGGASVALAESAASVGTWMNINQQTQAAVGLEINANHLRSKRDGVVTAIATPFHVGRKTMVWDIRIEDEQGKLVCISRCTVAVIDQQK